MRRAISVLSIAAVAAFAVAGCGDDAPPKALTKAEFKKEYAPISVEIRGLGVVASEALRSADGQPSTSVAATFKQLASKADSLATRLDETRPPEGSDLSAAHADLVAGLEKQADDLRAVSTAVSDKDQAEAKAAVKTLIRDAKGVSQPQAALVKSLTSSK